MKRRSNQPTSQKPKKQTSLPIAEPVEFPWWIAEHRMMKFPVVFSGSVGPEIDAFAKRLKDMRDSEVEDISTVEARFQIKHILNSARKQIQQAFGRCFVPLCQLMPEAALRDLKDSKNPFFRDMCYPELTNWDGCVFKVLSDPLTAKLHDRVSMMIKLVDIRFSVQYLDSTFRSGFYVLNDKSEFIFRVKIFCRQLTENDLVSLSSIARFFHDSEPNAIHKLLICLERDPDIGVNTLGLPVHDASVQMPETGSRPQQLGIGAWNRVFGQYIQACLDIFQKLVLPENLFFEMAPEHFLFSSATRSDPVVNINFSVSYDLATHRFLWARYLDSPPLTVRPFCAVRRYSIAGTTSGRERIKAALSL